MAGCCSGRRFEFLDVEFLGFVGPGLSRFCPCMAALSDFSTLPCTVEDTKRNAAKTCEITSVSITFVRCSWLWHLGWICCLTLDNSSLQQGECAGWEVVVGADLFTESFCIPSVFFPALVAACETLFVMERSLSLVGLVSFWTSHSHMSFLQTAAKGRRSCWPEHSLAAGLESGYCHNRKLFATWVPKSELFIYHFGITPKKITRHRLFRELMVWIWQAMSPSQQSYESSTGDPAYTFCAATHTSWFSEQLN